ncbi:MAG: TauD/TfdA family dioxygenase [Acidimicrobiales bacterium]
MLLTVARALGEPVGYRPEHGGATVQNLLPVRGTEATQTSTSSAVDLEFHTETAFHPHRPHHLLLTCLRSDSAASTYLCSVREVLPHLTARERAVLAEPRFRTRVDESFGGTPATPPGPPVAVLQGDPASPTLLFDADLMDGTDPEADAALRRLAAVALERRLAVVLQPGDLLVVDNHACIHGRSSFAARYDGTDRWLQRAFVVDDLASSAPHRTGRTIDLDLTVGRHPVA